MACVCTPIEHAPWLADCQLINLERTFGLKLGLSVLTLLSFSQYGKVSLLVNK